MQGKAFEPIAEVKKITAHYDEVMNDLTANLSVPLAQLRQDVVNVNNSVTIGPLIFTCR